MRATIYRGPRDVRLETVAEPRIGDSGDAIVRVTRAAICGSDLWFYRGISEAEPGNHTGHEFVGVVEEVGSGVRDVRPNDAVIAPFAYSDGSCEFCRAGLQTSCLRGGFFGSDGMGGQAEFVRVPLADGTLVKMPEAIAGDRRKHDASVALCDVMATGHHAVVRSETSAGSTVLVVGDGAVGLCAVHSAARIRRAERIIAAGHNAKRLEMAKRFGATHTFDTHDPNVLDEILELTEGGAPHAVEAVGNQESFDLALKAARPGGTVSFVGVPHNVKAPPIDEIFYKNLSLRGGACPARAYIPQLIESLEAGDIDPTPVLDLTLALGSVADGYAAMDERRAIKVLLEVS